MGGRFILPTKRAVTGCVAVAASQVLYYLHDTLGVPQKMFSEGVCTGNVNSFHKEFSNPTSEAWASMSPDYTYSSSDLTDIKINWGWSTQWTGNKNDDWYTLTGDWSVEDGNTYSYNNRKMVYGFSVAN